MAEFGLNTNGSSSKSKKGSSSILVGRVTKVILGMYTKEGKIDQDFVRQGGYASIGAVKYTLFQNGETVSSETKSDNFALPLFSNVKQYPLLGEIVLLVSGPGSGLNDNASDKKYFYITTVNLWNNQHHNAFPDLLDYANRVDSTSGTKDVDTRAYLGDYFNEKSDLKPLLPFEGDIMMEGRFGQSIRFGSTSKEQKYYNKWSTYGTNGDPITIITNKRSVSGSSNEPWVPSTEDINKDGSSIWMTSGQVVDMDVSKYPLDTYRLGYQQNYGPQTTLPLSDVTPAISSLAADLEDKINLERLK